MQSSPPIRVLVLDDEPMVLELLGHVFSTLGCIVKLVECGSEALGFIQNQSFDLLVLDQQVPDVDGSDPVPWVQAAAESRGVPVWACTSLCNTIEWNALLAQGYGHILAKPVSPDAVAGGLRTIADAQTLNNY
jgi:CheY-like chemotaxis protein